MADSPFTTPKRKRNEMLDDGTLKLNIATQFTFDVNSGFDDGNASPQTRVVHRFKGLVLGGGGGGAGPSAGFPTIDNEAKDASRKRIKLPDVEMLDADSPAAAAAEPAYPSPPRRPRFNKGGSPSRRRASPKSVRLALDDAVVGQSETVAHTSSDQDNDDTTTPSLTPPTPPAVTSRPLPQQQQPRTTKRAGTPPFRTTTTKPPSPESSTITDPLHASLTWHDDEITIYDPDDSDDDGTGINGIGFKPTPAIAYARTVRRRQQLAEYRKREEREARAKRSLMRRRGASPAPGVLDGGAGPGKKGKVGDRRRVRFLEREGAAAVGVAGELIGV
ncbi:hypothetical protein C8A01DRAFT_35188 [Parachaetomium inaequale]|uniref:Uncharacterized protein n=1 Tax=Parachaetomium inaequale TaxID=2588326 RepID=A0AAN6PIY2_9PEZI|nr:hypothetical protein C8A01DRAFT_35188 [Parachaetomium inaequale]